MESGLHHWMEVAVRCLASCSCWLKVHLKFSPFFLQLKKKSIVNCSLLRLGRKKVFREYPKGQFQFQGATLTAAVLYLYCLVCFKTKFVFICCDRCHTVVLLGEKYEQVFAGALFLYVLVALFCHGGTVFLSAGSESVYFYFLTLLAADLDNATGTD